MRWSAWSKLWIIFEESLMLSTAGLQEVINRHLMLLLTFLD
jgi:hypothetical protein